MIFFSYFLFTHFLNYFFNELQFYAFYAYYVAVRNPDIVEGKHREPSRDYQLYLFYIFQKVQFVLFGSRCDLLRLN